MFKFFIEVIFFPSERQDIEVGLNNQYDRV